MLDTIASVYVKIDINSCLHHDNRSQPHRFSRVKSQHGADVENLADWLFFTPIASVCRTIGCQCSGLMTRNRARFMNHGAVDLCKVLRKTGKKLRLAFGLRYRHLIDELHSLANSSIKWYGYKGSLTTRGSLTLKGM